MKIALILLFTLIITSCEDPVPTENYVEQYVVQAYLIAGEPIRNILIMKTLPIFDSLDLEGSVIRDAVVKIKSEDKEMFLSIDENGLEGYYYADTTYKVKQKMKYTLEVSFSDGKSLNAETIVPGNINWVSKPGFFIQYPLDTINKPSKDTLLWEGDNFLNTYSISITVLDTLNYGKYLDPPIEEKNRRIWRRQDQNRDTDEDERLGESFRRRENTQFGFIPNNKTPVLWNAFRWYGLHTIAIFNPDFYFLQANFQAFQGVYDYRLSNIKGDGIGSFGSASVIRDTFFIIKNQP